MKTVFDAMQAIDPDLYVRKIARWKEEQQKREGQSRRDNLIYMRPKESARYTPPEEERQEAADFMEPLTAGQRAALVLMAAAVAFTLCTFLFP